MNYEPMQTVGRRPAAATEAGVASFLTSTYLWMTGGLSLTGLVAWYTAHSPVLLKAIVGNQLLFFGLLIGQVLMVVGLTRKAASLSAPAAGAVFLGYAMLNGLTFSVIFAAYAGATIEKAFFMSAASFAGMAVFGATTKRSLAPVGQFMTMGLFGLMIAMVVNIFLRSPMMDFVVSCVGVLVFAGLTAYDNQRLRAMYLTTGGVGNLAIQGALTMYLNFINLFLFILRLVGGSRDR